MGKLNIRVGVLTLVLLLFSGVSLPESAIAMSRNVPVFLDPSEVSAAQGQVTLVSVKIDARNQPIDVAQVFLDFDPEFLQVVDANGIPTSSVEFGPIVSSGVWPEPLLNQVDNVMGRIGVAAGKGINAGGGEDANSEFVLATIRFTTLANVAATDVFFDTEELQSLQRTKVYYQGFEVTGPDSGAEIAILEPDTVPPGFKRGEVDADGKMVRVSFDKDLANSLPPGSAFEVSGSVSGTLPGTRAAVSIIGNELTFALANPIIARETAVLAYNQPPRDPRIQDAAGNLTVPFNSVVIANNSVVPPNSVHIGDLDGANAESRGQTWGATITISVHDSDHAPVGDATVIINWNGSKKYSGGTTQCTTNGNGFCNATTGDVIPNNYDPVTFNVNTVTGQFNYASVDNHDHEGDSSGTSIRISKR